MADQPEKTTALSEQRLGELLDSVSAKTPAPGGGAVASAAGALASALAGMVVSYSLGKKRLAEHQERLEESVGRLANARMLLLRLAEEDAEAYSAVDAAMRRPDTDGDRSVTLVPALQAAVAAPMNTLAATVDLLRLFRDLAGRTNHHLHSDLAIAAILAESAARSSEWNVRINLPLVRREISEEVAQQTKGQAAELLNQAGDLLDEIEDACRRSTGVAD